MTSEQKPTSLSGTNEILKRIDTDLAFDSFKGEPRWFRLPETTALNKNHIPHETLRAGLYVALECTGQLQEFYVMEDYNEFRIKADADSLYFGKIIFWENDRGTEDYRIIKNKLDKYLEMSRAYPERRFYVCFTTVTQYDRVGRVKRTAEGRARGILDLISTYKRADQFLVATHDFVLKYPTEAVFCSQLNPMGVAISDLR